MRFVDVLNNATLHLTEKGAMTWGRTRWNNLKLLYNNLDTKYYL